MSYFYRGMTLTSNLLGKMPQESILSLETNKAPLIILISRACKFLDVDLNVQWQQVVKKSEFHNRPAISSDPRPQWALDWLLRKLRLAEGQDVNPRLEWRAWMLLQALVLHVSIADSARLVKAHRLIRIIRKTLQEICDHRVPAAQPQTKGVPESSLPPPEAKITSKLLVSDSVVFQDPLQTTKKSKPHKKDNAEITEFDGLTVVGESDIHRTFVSICALLAQLELFTTDVGTTYEYAVEYMKNALKSNPEDAAKILGDSLYLVNNIIHERQRAYTMEQPNEDTLEEALYGLCASSMLHFWNTRFIFKPEDADNPANVSPSIHDGIHRG